MWEARGWRALRFRQVGSTLGEVEFEWLPSGSEVGCEKLFLLSGQLEIACRPLFFFSVGLLVLLVPGILLVVLPLLFLLRVALFDP